MNTRAPYSDVKRTYQKLHASREQKDTKAAAKVAQEKKVGIGGVGGRVSDTEFVTKGDIKKLITQLADHEGRITNLEFN